MDLNRFRYYYLMKQLLVRQFVIKPLSMKNIKNDIHERLINKCKSHTHQKNIKIFNKREIITSKGYIKMENDKLRLFKITPIETNINDNESLSSFQIKSKKIDVIKNHYYIIEHTTISQIPQENFIINKKIYEYDGEFSNMKLIIEEVNNKIYDVYFIINGNLDDLTKKDIRLFLGLLI